jgi:hypothetical protein
MWRNLRQMHKIPTFLSFNWDYQSAPVRSTRTYFFVFLE